MAISHPFPLYPTFLELKDFDLQNYPMLAASLKELPERCSTQWTWGFQFLLYIGRNKSDHTFIRFRSEIEKFLLWSFLIVDKPIDQLRKTDVLDYVEFSISRLKPGLDWRMSISSFSALTAW